jgi:hypothetical protein
LITLTNPLPGSDDTFNGGIVCQVEEEADVFHGSIFFEILFEESSGLHVDAHGCEDDGKVILVVVKYRLARETNQ